MAYNTNVGNNTLRPRTFYVLYIGLNDKGNGHLIFKLSTKQILITAKYQPIHIPKDIIEAINGTDSFINKIQVTHFNSYHSIVQNNHSDNNKVEDQTQWIDANNSKDESNGELKSSRQLNGIE